MSYAQNTISVISIIGILLFSIYAFGQVGKETNGTCKVTKSMFGLAGLVVVISFVVSVLTKKMPVRLRSPIYPLATATDMLQPGL